MEIRVQIRPILYSSQPIGLQIFFCVSDNDIYIYVLGLGLFVSYL